MKHFSRKTEESYVAWYKGFVVWHGKRHPKDMGAGHVQAFLMGWRGL
jgi:Phage integrase, N-terminal SAM-like domain